MGNIDWVYAYAIILNMGYYVLFMHLGFYGDFAAINPDSARQQQGSHKS